jgi:photosystem II stability/assembly factor-like uncharacterized protein
VNSTERTTINWTALVLVVAATGFAPTLRAAAVQLRPENSSAAGFPKPTSRGDLWERINPGGGGWFQAVKAGPTGTIIVCSDVSGAYRSLDRGRSWDVIGSVRGLQFTHTAAVGFDPADATIIYLGTDEGLYRSADHGEAFTKVSPGGYWGDIAISPADPNVGYAARHAQWNGLDGQVYRTTNRGRDWSQVSQGLPLNLRILRLVVHPSNKDILYLVSGKHRFATGAKELHRSADGGVKWSKIGPEGDIYDLALDPVRPTTVWAAVENAGVYQSTDGGKLWSLSTSNWGRLLAKSSSVIRVIRDSGSVYETTNAGTHWTEKSSASTWTPGWRPGWHWGGNGSIAFLGSDLSDPDAYFWINPQFVYGSFDGGTTFKALYTREEPAGSNRWSSAGVDNTEVYDLELSESDPNLVFIGLWDMGLWRSQDRGATWQTCNQGDFGWIGGRGGDCQTVLTDPARANVVWASLGERTSHGHLLKSTESGKLGSWVEVGAGLPAPNQAVEFWGLSLSRTSPHDNRTLFVTGRGRVYQSTNDGNYWSEVFTNARCRITAVDNFNGHIVYAGGDGGVWRSLSGGSPGTWAKVGTAEMTGVYDLKCGPSRTGWVFVACYGTGKGVYRSQDSGTNWTKLWTNSYARGVAIHKSDTNILYATSSRNSSSGASPIGSAGVVRSTDGGMTWLPVNEGLPWPFAWPVEVHPTDPNWVFIGAPGTGFYRRQFASPHPNSPTRRP